MNCSEKTDPKSAPLNEPENATCGQSFVWLMKHAFASVAGGARSKVPAVGSVGQSHAEASRAAPDDVSTEDIVAALGKGFAHTRPAVKTHKESKKKKQCENSKYAQLCRVVDLVLNQKETLFDRVTDISENFKGVYNSCSGKVKRACIQVDATQLAEELAVFRPKDNHEFKNGCLVYRMDLPGGWSDYSAYDTETGDADAVLLDRALAYLQIEKFLEEKGHEVHHVVGVAPLSRADIVGVSEKDSKFYSHCKSGQGRGPFIPMVAQLLRVLHNNPGMSRADLLAILSGHNQEMKRRVLPRGCTVAAGVLAVLGVGGTMLAAYESYACMTGESGFAGNTTTAYAASEPGLVDCVQTQPVEMPLLSAAASLLGSAAIGVYGCIKRYGGAPSSAGGRSRSGTGATEMTDVTDNSGRPSGVDRLLTDNEVDYGSADADANAYH